MKIAIIGAGLAGLCAARSLHEAGAGEVTVFERRAGPGLETSHANGALLHPSHVEPWNSPGILGVLLRNLGNEEAAVLLRLRALPSLLGWGWRFVRESSAARHRAHTLANVALALRSVKLMHALRANGIDDGFTRAGSLSTFRDATAFSAAQQHARWLNEQGVPSRPVSRDELVALEPALGPSANRLAGAVQNAGDEPADAYRFCLSMAARLASQGVQFAWSSEVRALLAERGAVTGVRLADGTAPRFDAVVLAAAWWSVGLAAPLGLRLPIRPVKGYSLTLTWPESMPPRPRLAVLDNDLHIALVPLADPRTDDSAAPPTASRLRVAGTAEFNGEDRVLDARRTGNLLRQVQQVYPQAAEQVAGAPRQEWTALRPMCADGKPLVGATRVRGLWLNTGHGQLGWTTGAGSGELLAALMMGQAAAVAPAPFSPGRFGL